MEDMGKVKNEETGKWVRDPSVDDFTTDAVQVHTQGLGPPLLRHLRSKNLDA